MELEEQLYSVLIVSSSEKFNQLITGLLPAARYSPVRIVQSVGMARQTLFERYFDIVIINTPLPDDFGTRLAIDVGRDSGAGVLIFVKSEHFNEIYNKVAAFGVLAISMPSTSAVVTQSLLLLCATRERLRRMEKKTATLEEKMEEIRYVNRAKWLLIEELKMSEADAHRYIEKQAMDRCVTKRAIAETIIKTYS